MTELHKVRYKNGGGLRSAQDSFTGDKSLCPTTATKGKREDTFNLSSLSDEKFAVKTELIQCQLLEAA